MDQEPATPPPSEPADGKPKLFQNMNGWIAGLTGLVVALGGLATAYKEIWGDKQPAAATAPAKAPAPAEPAAAAATNSEPEQGEPTLFEGDGVRLEWVGEEWLLTGTDGTYHYEDVYSSDETRYLGYDKANKAYLRWPIKGGMSEEGSEDKQSWTNYVAIDPVADDSAAQ